MTSVFKTSRRPSHPTATFPLATPTFPPYPHSEQGPLCLATPTQQNTTSTFKCCENTAFSSSVSHHALLSPSLFWFFSKLPSHSPSNTMSHSHTTSLISHNSGKSFICSKNLFEFSSSPHSLNFTQPILALAVTAASQSPLAFNLSPK